MSSPHEDGDTLPAPDHLRDHEYERLAAFVEDYCGIRLPPNKQTMVEGRLRRRVRSLGLAGITEYYHHIFSPGVPRNEIVALIDALTTNKTEFFRENDHFVYLMETVLPSLLQQPHRPGIERPLKIWSAACSTGAEPYTLAMLLDDFTLAHRNFRFTIFATDICVDVLEDAKMAVYPREMMAPVRHDFLNRYVRRARDPRHETVRLIPEIRQSVRFGRLNLMDDSYPIDDDMDIIFCRNILIYFNKQNQEAVLRKLCQHLRPGGYLFLGHSETTAGMTLPLQCVTTTVFTRR